MADEDRIAALEAEVERLKALTAPKIATAAAPKPKIPIFGVELDPSGNSNGLNYGGPPTIQPGPICGSGGWGASWTTPLKDGTWRDPTGIIRSQSGEAVGPKPATRPVGPPSLRGPEFVEKLLEDLTPLQGRK